jgi:hypothetical protein
MVIEAGVAAAYVIAWAIRKAKRVGGRLDEEADGVIDVSLDRLHKVVMAKLGGHPALAELAEEAEAAGDDTEVSDLTRQQVELALKAAARKDEAFGQALTELVARLREAERAVGSPVIAGSRSTVFVGDAHVMADGGGIGFGQVAGNVHVIRRSADPTRPGRPGN